MSLEQIKAQEELERLIKIARVDFPWFDRYTLQISQELGKISRYVPMDIALHQACINLEQKLNLRGTEDVGEDTVNDWEG